MLKDRVKCAVANPGGPIDVSSTIILGAAASGFRSFLAAFGSGNPAYFVLSDGAGKALGGIWTVNGDGTATITSILINDRTGGTDAETFSSACVAFCALPAAGIGGQLIAAATAAAARSAIGAAANPTTSPGILGTEQVLNSGSGSSLIAPSGGTWVCKWQGFNNATGSWVSPWEIAEVAGGTTLKAGSSGIIYIGHAYRKA